MPHESHGSVGKDNENERKQDEWSNYNHIVVNVIGIFGICLFSNLHMHIHFYFLLGLNWKASSKEDDYVFQGFILKITEMGSVRILLVEKYMFCTVRRLSSLSFYYSPTILIPLSLSSCIGLLSATHIFLLCVILKILH